MREKKKQESLGHYADAVRRTLHTHVRAMLRQGEALFKPDYDLRAFFDRVDCEGQPLTQYYLGKPVSDTHVTSVLAAFVYEAGVAYPQMAQLGKPCTSAELLSRLMGFWNWNQDAVYPMTSLPVAAVLELLEGLLVRLEADSLYCELRPIVTPARCGELGEDAPSDLLGISLVSAFDRLASPALPVRLDLYWYGPCYVQAQLKLLGVLV